MAEFSRVQAAQHYLSANRELWDAQQRVVGAFTAKYGAVPDTWALYGIGHDLWSRLPAAQHEATLVAMRGPRADQERAAGAALESIERRESLPLDLLHAHYQGAPNHPEAALAYAQRYPRPGEAQYTYEGVAKQLAFGAFEQQNVGEPLRDVQATRACVDDFWSRVPATRRTELEAELPSGVNPLTVRSAAASVAHDGDTVEKLATMYRTAPAGTDAAARHLTDHDLLLALEAKAGEVGPRTALARPQFPDYDSYVRAEMEVTRGQRPVPRNTSPEMRQVLAVDLARHVPAKYRDQAVTARSAPQGIQERDRVAGAAQGLAAIAASGLPLEWLADRYRKVPPQSASEARRHLSTFPALGIGPVRGRPQAMRRLDASRTVRVPRTAGTQSRLGLRKPNTRHGGASDGRSQAD